MDVQQVAQEAVGSLGSQVAQLQLMLRVAEVELAAEREAHAETKARYEELKSAFDSLAADEPDGCPEDKQPGD